MKSIASVFLVVLFFSGVAHASSANKGYCQNAETTADLVECITTHQNAEDVMTQDIFKRLEIMNPDGLEDLKTNHNEWIIHRDKTCDLQAKIYEGGSLQRVEQLHCRAKMTDDRNQTLQNILTTYDQSYIPEYSNPPRWVNVLVRDYPNMFWGFGSAQKIDTDCDGQDENIIRAINGDKMNIAIVDSENTGRPKVTMIDFDDSQNCEILPDINIKKFSEPKPEGDAQLTCMQSITFQTKSCGDFAVHYNSTDQTYSLKK